MSPKSSPFKKQAGLTLVESLVALVVLALGVLGLAAVQTRMLVETRITNSRASAVRLIADLGERLQLNKAGAQAPLGGRTPYEFTRFEDPAAAPGVDCRARAVNPAGACTPAEMAAYDVWAWRQQVAGAMFNGQATITQNAVDSRQLEVVIAWQLNERNNSALADQLGIAFGAGGGSRCPTGFICHLGYLQIPVNR